MKNVIKTVAAALMLLIGSQAFAQSFGAGYVQSTDSGKNTSNGFYAGFGYSAEIMPGLSLNPGLYYEFLTASSSSNVGSIFSASGKTTEHYINVPLHLSYAISFAPTFKVFVYGGPTANVGIASNTVLSASVLGVSGSETVNNYENENYSRFDVLAGAGAGIEVMNKFRLNVGYDWGLFDRDKSDNAVLKRNRLTAGVAFVF